MPDEKIRETKNTDLDLEVSFHSLDTKEVLDKLGAPADTGLTTQEAEQRLQRYGYNQLQEAKPPSFLKMVFDQLNNFVVILLIAAAIISAFGRDH